MTILKKATEKKIFRNALMVTFLFLPVSFASAQSADYDFSGSWKTDQGPLVQITKSGDTFKAVNLEHDKLVLENLKYDDDKWTGTLIRPKDGKKFDCTVTVSGNEMKLTVKRGFMSKTLTWVKQ